MKEPLNTTDPGTTQPGFWTRSWHLYRDGFRNLSPTGRALWILILVKLFVMFAILRLFFFPNYLNTHTDSDEGKSDFVAEQFVQRVSDHN